MPICPHCKKFTSFHDYGIDNILEGEDAEEFIKNFENPPPLTEKQKAMFRKASEIYKANPI